MALFVRRCASLFALLFLAATVAGPFVAGPACGANDGIVNKNLFSSDRKPPAPPPKPKPPPEVGLKELKQVKLIAIYTLGTSKKALVYAPNSVIENKKAAKGGKKVWVREGNVMAGYTVKEITPMTVTMENEDGDQHVMRLRPEKKKKKR